jgi:hypothetical protein
MSTSGFGFSQNPTQKLNNNNDLDNSLLSLNERLLARENKLLSRNNFLSVYNYQTKLIAPPNTPTSSTQAATQATTLTATKCISAPSKVETAAASYSSPPSFTAYSLQPKSFKQIDQYKNAILNASFNSAIDAMPTQCDLFKCRLLIYFFNKLKILKVQ